MISFPYKEIRICSVKIGRHPSSRGHYLLMYRYSTNTNYFLPPKKPLIDSA